MRRLTTVLAALVVIGSLPAAAPAATKATTIALRTTSKGPILVNDKSYTLYAFTLDKRNHDACAGIYACLSLWPAVTTAGKVTAGHGVNKSLLGTIAFRGHRKQITYAGHPLYTYAEDTRPAQTSNIDILQFGGRWPALNAAGKLIR